MRFGKRMGVVGMFLVTACGGAPGRGPEPTDPRPQSPLKPSPPATARAPARAEDTESPEVADRYARYLARYADIGYTDLTRELRIAGPRKVELGFDPKTARYFPEVSRALRFTEEDAKRLSTLGVISVDPVHEQSMASGYYDIYTHDLPVLVTTDSILDALHRSYDKILKELELLVLAPTLASVLAAAHEEVVKQTAETLPADVATSLGDVDVYLAVARNLLAGAGAPGDLATGPVYTRGPNAGLVVPSATGRDAEIQGLLGRIAGTRLEGGSRMELRGGKRPIDYSQFIPRGHYTETNELKRYFRAMMWLGRADTGFLLSPPSADSGLVVDVPRERRGAAVLAKVLASSHELERLESMNAIVDLLVGTADSLGPRQLDGALSKAGLGSIADFGDEKTSRVIDSLATSSRQRILSQIMNSPEDGAQSAAPPSLFQLFGQRFLLDSYVESKVVFDSIIFRNEKQDRTLPSGLDVMAAFGNEEAVRLLEPALRRFNYSANLLAAEKVVEDVLPETWNQNVYGLWLDSLRTLDDVPPEPSCFPAAMKSEAWERKQLRTALSSWAELRHDTLLYAKQSYGSTEGCQYPEGFVEPYPEFFDKLRDLAHLAGDRLGHLDSSFPDPKVMASATGIRDLHSKYFQYFEGTMTFLGSLARKELASQPFSPEEEVFLKSTIDEFRMSGGAHYDGWYPKLIYGDEKSEYQPTIADVHTYPGGRGRAEVLEVGTGRTNYVVVAIDNQNDHAIYVGPSFSYYELSVPPEARMRDASFAQLLREGERAPRPPDWEGMFQMPARDVDLGPRTLKEPPMTPAQKAALLPLRKEYEKLMQSNRPNMTPAERLRFDERLRAIQKKADAIVSPKGCGCPPGAKVCPCVND